MKAKDVTGAVLAGGMSKRMGRDKASLVVAGKPMLAHVVDSLCDVFDEVLVVAKDAARPMRPGVRVVSDVLPGSAALVGIYTALCEARTPYVFVMACDMPFVNPDLVRWMVQACQGRDAFIPRIGGNVEPLFALYSKKCRPVIETRLQVGDMRVRGFFQDVNVGYAEEDLLRRIDPDLRSFTNINTREDLQKGVPSSE